MVSFAPIAHDGRVQRSCKAALRAGYQVVIFTRNDGSSPFAELEECTHIPIGSPPMSSTSGGGGGRARGLGVSGPARFVKQLVRVALYARRVRSALRDVNESVLYCHDADALLVALIRRPKGALVYDAHEYWPDKNEAVQMRRLSLTAFVEGRVVRRADRVVTVGAAIAALYWQRYGLDQLPLTIRNYPDHDTEFESVAPDLSGLVHIGNIGPNRGLELAIDALVDLPETDLTMVGSAADATYLETLQSRARERGVADRLHVRAPVPPADVVRTLAKTGAVSVVLIQATSKSYELAMPNKLFESLAAGLPVIVAPRSEMAAFVTETAAGVVMTADTADALVDAVRSARADDAALRDQAQLASSKVRWSVEREALVDMLVGLHPG